MSAALWVAIVAALTGLLIIGTIAALGIFILVLIVRFVAAAIEKSESALGGCLFATFIVACIVACLLLAYAWTTISSALRDHLN
jgi:hypothetical protein